MGIWRDFRFHLLVVGDLERHRSQLRLSVAFFFCGCIAYRSCFLQTGSGVMGCFSHQETCMFQHSDIDETFDTQRFCFLGDIR